MKNSFKDLRVSLPIRANVEHSPIEGSDLIPTQIYNIDIDAFNSLLWRSWYEKAIKRPSRTAVPEKINHKTGATWPESIYHQDKGICFISLGLLIDLKIIPENEDSSDIFLWMEWDHK